MIRHRKVLQNDYQKKLASITRQIQLFPYNENFKKQGWGLGLAIAKEIINAHGGEIGADSAGRGTGSTFWLTIPLANAK